MKPFNLEAAKRGEPIISRGSNDVGFIAHVPEARLSNQVVCLHGVQILTHFEDGRCTSYSGESSLDLFMAPKKRIVWVNLYVIHCQLRYQFTTEKEANEYDRLGAERIGGKAYPVEIEE